MKSHDDLSRELARLLQQAEQTRKAERDAAIADILTKMADYGLTVEDLAPRSPEPAGTDGASRPKDGHPDNDET